MIITQTLPPVLYSVLLNTLIPGAGSASLPIGIGTPALITASKLSQFDYMAPGLIAFASIFLIMTVAESFVSDKEKGLLKRINTTPATPSDVIAGQATSNVVLVLMQTGMIFGMAALVGFRPAVGIDAYAMAFFMSVIFAP